MQVRVSLLAGAIYSRIELKETLIDVDERYRVKRPRQDVIG